MSENTVDHAVETDSAQEPAPTVITISPKAKKWMKIAGAVSGSVALVLFGAHLGRSDDESEDSQPSLLDDPDNDSDED